MLGFIQYLLEAASHSGVRHVREIYHGPSEMPSHIYNLDVSAKPAATQEAHNALSEVMKITGAKGKGSLQATSEYMKPIHEHWTQYLNHANGESKELSAQGFRDFIQDKHDAVNAKTGKPKASSTQRKSLQTTLSHIDQHHEHITQHIEHHNAFRNHINSYIDQATQYHAENNKAKGISQHLGDKEYGVEGFTFAGSTKTPHRFNENELNTISPDRGHYEHIHELLSKGVHGVTAVHKIIEDLSNHKIGLQAKAEGKSAFHIVTRAHPVTGQTQHGIAMKGIDNKEPKIAWDTGDAHANHAQINNIFGYNQRGEHRPELVNTLHKVLQSAHHLTNRTSRTPGSVQVDFLGNHGDFHESENGDVHTTPNVIKNIWRKGSPAYKKVEGMIENEGFGVAIHSSFDSPNPEDEHKNSGKNPGTSVLNTMKLVKFGSKDTGFAAYNRKFGGALVRKPNPISEETEISDTFSSHKPTSQHVVVTIGRFTTPHNAYLKLQDSMKKLAEKQGADTHIFASHRFEPYAKPKKGTNSDPIKPPFKHGMLRQTFTSPVHLTTPEHSGYIGTLRRVAGKYSGKIHLVLGSEEANAAKEMIEKSKNLPDHGFLHRVVVHQREGEEGIHSSDMRKLAISASSGDERAMTQFTENLAPTFLRGSESGGITPEQVVHHIAANSQLPPKKPRKKTLKEMMRVYENKNSRSPDKMISPTEIELDTFKQFVSKINPKDAYETAAAEYEKNPDDPFTQAKLKALFPIAKKKMN